MATITNQQIKFALLQNVLATYVGKIFDNPQMATDYASSNHDALVSAVWSAFVNGQELYEELDMSKCNKVAMIKALRTRVQGTVCLTIALPTQWGDSKLRDSIIENTCYHPTDNNELREYRYHKTISLKDAKDFCDWMIDIMLNH